VTTDVDVLNACLALNGGTPVESRDDPDAVAAWASYDEAVGRVLGGYPWKFLRVTRALARDATPASAQWSYSFQVPADLSGHPRAVYATADGRVPFTEWERAGDKILSHEPSLWMRYGRTTAGPDEWPPPVAACIRAALRGELALAIREDARLREAFLVQAFGSPSEGGRGGLYGQARTLDAQAEPSTVLAMGRNPLITARG
jgi:hypothetical protein